MKSIQECHPKNLHFKVTREYDTEKLWLSDRFNIENFHPIRFYIRLEYTDNWPKEMDVGKYSVTLGVVSPEAMGEEGWQHAKESVGMETLQTKDGFSAAEVCIDYGTAAPFKQWNGNNLKKVLKLAREELNIVCMMVFMLSSYSH